MARARCSSRHIYLSARVLEGSSWSTTALYTPGYRFLSTNPPPTVEPSSKEAPHVVHNSSSRKPKVELRPGPVKPPKATSDTAPTSASLASSSHSDSANPVHTVIEVAKEDYQEASKHGILAPPPPNASWAGKLFHQAKELFKFYWNGIKLINTHRKRVRDINARVKAGGAPLSRWETRFIANYKRDALKLIPFALIIIIAEEAIPLVVIYTPFLLPSTCLLPSQKERIDAKRREKQRSFAELMQPVFEGVHSRALSQPDASLDVLLDKSALISYNGVLSLSTFGPPPMRLRRIKKHLRSIAADDELLFRENSGERLSVDELREALEERGMCVCFHLSLRSMLRSECHQHPKGMETVA
ncbi:hypothetical protein NUW54_g2023 [Trametes sanguinea]|uniref:Uncharacterized protein n=1 Tax=Trametes sanguinea TaxID=158606 RepID=A0ACC1Q4P3_9APHY|nr:hypothetical protein NUW54_g2023 [Trametes sanguinea]